LLAPPLRFAVVFAGVAVGALLFFALAPALGLLAGIALLALEGAASLIAFQAGVVWPVVTLAAATTTCFAAIYAYRFVVEDKQKRWIQHAFRHYLAPVMVERLAADPSALSLGGTRRDVTVFFSDLAGFTTFSETLKDEPETLLDILNEYLTVVTEVIERDGGYVDKFIGDAVMAIWGAPLDDAEAERHAVNAAIDAQAALVDFNDKLVRERPGTPRLHTRIGINSGPAVVGNMGSRTRLNYTVGGDTVNLAARLEGANKVYGSSILIGGDTANALGEGYVMRCVDYLVVKGKAEPVRAYEVVGRVDAVPEEVAARVTAFNDAYRLYLDRQFEAARAAFAVNQDYDAAAALYIERCAHFVAAPPGPDWDGSFTMTTK
jgi:class 3 adenylate cyclase